MKDTATTPTATITTPVSIQALQASIRSLTEARDLLNLQIATLYAQLPPPPASTKAKKAILIKVGRRPAPSPTMSVAKDASVSSPLQP